MTPIKAWLGYSYPFGPGEGEIPRDPSQVEITCAAAGAGRVDDVGITGMVGQGQNFTDHELSDRAPSN
jgi:hypothetical protein